MKTSIVIGLCFGDEGKGALVASLSKPNDLVIRFNGGHQCGHTVEKYGYRHVFSSFGSGTLSGSHTFISKYCTLYPKAFFNEQETLKMNGYTPSVFVHPLTMITTPYDVFANRQSEDTNKHGSCGVGFGATIARNETTPFKLYAIDLTCKDLLNHKLQQIANYYGAEMGIEADMFLKYAEEINMRISTLEEIKNNYDNIIFEGGQGIMLDMDFGFSPNVTRSNTTSKNAMQIIKDSRLPKPDVYYVMRSYLTRHGNGFMPNESKELYFEDKTNVTNKYQGDFRQGYHSLEMLKYAIGADSSFSGKSNKRIVISCLDQTDNLVLIDNKKQTIEDLLCSLDMPLTNIHHLPNPLTHG